MFPQEGSPVFIGNKLLRKDTLVQVVLAGPGSIAIVGRVMNASDSIVELYQACYYRHQERDDGRLQFYLQPVIYNDPQKALDRAVTLYNWQNVILFELDENGDLAKLHRNFVEQFKSSPQPSAAVEAKGNVQ